MLITEVLTTPGTWIETDNWAKLSEYEMNVQGLVYEVLFTREPVDHKDTLWIQLQIPNTVKHVWQLAFAPQRPAATVKAGEPYTAYGTTNAGNSIAVFATVLEIIRDFATKHKGQYIMFSAKEPSRIRLYDRLVKRISSQSQVANVDGLRYYVMLI